MQQAVFAVVLVSVLALAGAAKAPASTSDITACYSVAQWLGLATPQQGTTFCPTNKAFQDFAKASGHGTWSALWGDAQANPAAWKPYIQRLFSYHSAPSTAALSSLSEGTVSTGLSLGGGSLPSSAGGVAQPGQAATFTLTRRGAYMMAMPSVPAGAKGAKARVKGARVLATNVVSSTGAVVHAIDSVLMPPNTYHTIGKALKADTGMRAMARYMNQHEKFKSLSTSASSFYTVVAPTDTAFKTINLRVKPLPAWMGNITVQQLGSNRDLRAAVLAYQTIPAQPSASGNGTASLTFDDLVNIWKLAAGQNFVSLPTALTAPGSNGQAEQQYAMYTYDESSGNIYLVGGRNARASMNSNNKLYMAGSTVSKVTVYAGCSTLLTVDGYVPLPLKTGVKAGKVPFDAGPAPEACFAIPHNVFERSAWHHLHRQTVSSIASSAAPLPRRRGCNVRPGEARPGARPGAPWPRARPPNRPEAILLLNALVICRPAPIA